MICTDTDHYVNTLSTIKNEKKKNLLAHTAYTQNTYAKGSF